MSNEPVNHPDASELAATIQGLLNSTGEVQANVHGESLVVRVNGAEFIVTVAEV